jgi:hypothetical protein
MPSPRLNKAEFRTRFLSQFRDPAFAPLGAELDKIATAAWDDYDHHRKSPRTRKAGSEFADPNYELAIDWLEARAAIAQAQRRHDQRSTPAILLINGSSRSEHTCPGEMSKSYRVHSRRHEGKRPGRHCTHRDGAPRAHHRARAARQRPARDHTALRLRGAR